MHSPRFLPRRSVAALWSRRSLQRVWSERWRLYFPVGLITCVGQLFDDRPEGDASPTGAAGLPHRGVGRDLRGAIATESPLLASTSPRLFSHFFVRLALSVNATTRAKAGMLERIARSGWVQHREVRLSRTSAGAHRTERKGRTSLQSTRSLSILTISPGRDELGGLLRENPCA